MLGTLLRSGVPLLPALEAARATLGNAGVRRAMAGVGPKVRAGSALSAELAATGLFPAMLTDIVAVGEQTGSLETALLGLAEDYEGEIDRTVRTLVALIEPVLILLVGGAVGFVVLALILPIFEINEVIQ